MDVTRSHDKLLEQYQLLLQEVEQLRIENHRLRNLLRQNAEDTDEDVLLSRMDEESSKQFPCVGSAAAPMIGPGKVDRFSSPEDKIALFRSLFVGRDDVFARRWVQRKTGKSGYQPVCKNEWTSLCDMRRLGIVRILAMQHPTYQP